MSGWGKCINLFIYTYMVSKYTQCTYTNIQTYMYLIFYECSFHCEMLYNITLALNTIPIMYHTLPFFHMILAAWLTSLPTRVRQQYQRGCRPRPPSPHISSQTGTKGCAGYPLVQAAMPLEQRGHGERLAIFCRTFLGSRVSLSHTLGATRCATP